MNFSTRLNKAIKMVVLVLIIIGSTEISAQKDEAKAVTIMVGESGFDGCELLGKVKGSSKDDPTPTGEDNTPYTERLIKARNNLRDAAHTLGGNTVHIIHANNSGKYEIPGADKEIIFIGNVYRCD